MKRSACKRARRLIVQDWDQRISLEGGFQLEAHLAGCTACAALAARHAELDEAFARLPEPPVARIDLDAAIAAVRTQLPDTSVSPAERRHGPRLLGRPFGRPFLMAAIGGLAAAALVFVLSRPAATPELPDHERPDGGRDPVVSAEVGPRASGEELAVPTPVQLEVPAPPAADEFARLEQARAIFRAELLTAGELLAEPAGIVLLDEATRELRAAEWPLRSLAEGLLDDPEVAPAAVRYLGWRGNRRSATLLARRLDEPALAHTVVVALGQLGPHGFSGLGRALERETTRALALDALVRGGAVRELTRALRTDGSSTSEQRTELARALAVAGGLGELLELATHGAASEAEWLAGLDAVLDPAAELELLAERARDGSRAQLLLRGIAHGRVAALLPWVERQTVEREHAEEAFRTLSAVGGIEGARSWLRLAVADRVDKTALDVVAASLAVEQPYELKPLVAEVAAQGDYREGEELLSLLALAPPRAAVPSLVAYASTRSFPDDQRQWAVLTVAERGDITAQGELAALFAELDASDRLLAAAVLQTLYALGGEAAVWEATLDLGRNTREELVTLFVDNQHTARDRSPGRAVTLLELARRVGPALPDSRYRGTQP